MSELAYTCCGYAEYDGLSGAGFLLPVFTLPESDELFIQLDRGDNSIGVMQVDLSGAAITAISYDNSFDITNIRVMAFRDDSSRVHVGSLGDLVPVFRAHSERYPNDAAVNLQIAEICGNKEDRRIARARMTEAIRRQSGMSVASRFRDISLGTSVFWSLLLQHSCPGKGREELHGRKRFVLSNFSVSHPLLLPNDVWLHLDKFIECSPEELVRLFKTEIMIPRIEDYREEIAGADFEGDLRSVINEISGKYSPFQRIAFLFRSFITKPKMGALLLERYRDDHQTVTYAIQVLLARLERIEEFGGTREGVVASLIPTLTKMRSGGAIALADLAKELSDIPEIDEAIRIYLLGLSPKKKRTKKQNVTPAE